MKKSIFLFFAAILCAIGMNATTWTVAGDKEIVNGTTAWKQDETKNDLTNVSGTKWGLLVENKTLSKKSYYFKITKDHKWDTSYPGSNYDFKIGAAGTYNIIYRFNTSGNSVEADYFQTWTVAGSGTVLTDEWTPGATANDMTRNGNTFEYVLTKKNVKLTAGNNYECKVCKDHAWGTAYPSQNKAFSVSTTGNYDVIFTFNVATTDVTVTTTPVYTITASANPATAGTITGAGTYAKDASVTLEATANAGYEFVNWTVGGVEKSTDATYSFTASANVDAVANFELSDPAVPTYAITVSANNDAMGTVTGAGDYTEGSPVTLTATPNAGYRFVKWTVGSEVKSTETTYSFTASEALTIVANFEAIPKYDITVKAVVPEAWTSATIGIHYWGDGISGTSNPVATEKDGNWNKYTIKNVLEGQSVNVIFLNGTSWGSDKSKQTANIMDITEDKCFQISAKTLDGEGKCTVKEVDCAADIKPEGDVYTMMGAGELGLSWNLETTGNDMTKQADGTYTLVKEGLDLATTGTYEYKVVKNHSWDWSIPSGAENQTLKVDKDGTYTVTFTLSADKKKLTADALCTAEKEVILDCFVAGTTNLVGGTSDFTDKLAMTYDEGTKTYSKTFTALAAGNYQMKVVYGSDWLGYDKLTKPVPANVTEGDDKKIKFSLAEAGDVTVTYHATNGIGLTGNFAAPAPEAKKYYVKGTHNEWTADATSEMTLDGEVYKKEVTLAKDVEFKINDGADAWWGKDNLGGKSYNELEGLEGGNLKMKEAKTFTIIFSPTANLITFEGLTENEPETLVYYVEVPEGTEDCYIAGQMNEWAFQRMTQVDATHWTITYDNVLKTTEYKYACQASWDYKELDKEGNDIANRTWTASDKVEKWAEPAEVSYIRNVTNKYGTICLPYASASTSGAYFYKVAGKETGKVYLKSVDALEAGVPYIFEATASQITVVYTGDPVVAPVNEDANGLVGTFTDNTVVDEGNYILKDNELSPSDGTAKVNANRAYLVMSEVSGGAPQPMPGRRYIGMSVQGENETTGLDNITNGENTTIKLIENGQLIIIRGGEKFNAQGQKL